MSPVTAPEPAVCATDAFDSPRHEEPVGHCVVTLLCTLRSEAARRRYLELTREIALPRKAAAADCLRVSQLVPLGADRPQVLWLQEWTSPEAFRSFMRRLFAENPRLSEVNDCLAFTPEVTISRFVRDADASAAAAAR